MTARHPSPSPPTPSQAFGQLALEELAKQKGEGGTVEVSKTVTSNFFVAPGSTFRYTWDMCMIVMLAIVARFIGGV